MAPGLNGTLSTGLPHAWALGIGQRADMCACMQVPPPWQHLLRHVRVREVGSAKALLGGRGRGDASPLRDDCAGSLDAPACTPHRHTGPHRAVLQLAQAAPAIERQRGLGLSKQPSESLLQESELMRHCVPGSGVDCGLAMETAETNDAMTERMVGWGEGRGGGQEAAAGPGDAAQRIRARPRA